jgi:hypothetical protein
MGGAGHLPVTTRHLSKRIDKPSSIEMSWLRWDLPLLPAPTKRSPPGLASSVASLRETAHHKDAKPDAVLTYAAALRGILLHVLPADSSSVHATEYVTAMVRLAALYPLHPPLVGSTAGTPWLMAARAMELSVGAAQRHGVCFPDIPETEGLVPLEAAAFFRLQARVAEATDPTAWVTLAAEHTALLDQPMKSTCLRPWVKLGATFLRARAALHLCHEHAAADGPAAASPYAAMVVTLLREVLHAPASASVEVPEKARGPLRALLEQAQHMYKTQRDRVAQAQLRSGVALAGRAPAADPPSPVLLPSPDLTGSVAPPIPPARLVVLDELLNSRTSAWLAEHPPVVLQPGAPAPTPNPDQVLALVFDMSEDAVARTFVTAGEREAGLRACLVERARWLAIMDDPVLLARIRAVLTPN